MFYLKRGLANGCCFKGLDLPQGWSGTKRAACSYQNNPKLII